MACGEDHGWTSLAGTITTDQADYVAQGQGSGYRLDIVARADVVVSAAVAAPIAKADRRIRSRDIGRRS